MAYLHKAVELREKRWARFRHTPERSKRLNAECLAN